MVDPVDGILESFDKNVVESDLGLVLLDQLAHLLLSGSRVVYDVTQVGINLVEVLQVSIHVVGYFLELGNLETSWRNVSLEL